MAGLGGGTAVDKSGNVIPWGSSHPGWSTGASGIGSSPVQQPAVQAQPMVSTPTGSGPSTPTSGTGNAALQALIGKISQGSSGGPSQPSSPVVNSAERNPVAERQNALLEAAANGDMNAPRMIDLANSKARDVATGLMLENARNKQRLGTGGGGAEDLTNRKISSDVQRAAAGNAANITIDRENARNDLRSKIIANSYSGDAVTDAAKRTAIAQHESLSNIDLARERNGIARDDQLIGLLRDPIYGSDLSSSGYLF